MIISLLSIHANFWKFLNVVRWRMIKYLDFWDWMHMSIYIYLLCGVKSYIIPQKLLRHFCKKSLYASWVLSKKQSYIVMSFCSWATLLKFIWINKPKVWYRKFCSDYSEYFCYYYVIFNDVFLGNIVYFYKLSKLFLGLFSVRNFH